MIEIQKILCPVDFFPASMRAVDYAIAVARNYESRLTLLHVVSPIWSAAYELPFDGTPQVTAMTADSRRRLTELSKKARDSNVQVDCIVRVGHIHEEIKDIISAEQTDFIVMGTHGRHGFGHWFMGSVTERLLRHVTVPLLTIRTMEPSGLAPPSLRRILMATDFSQETVEAIAYAFSLAQECQATVVLLHVIDDRDVDTNRRYTDPLELIHGLHSQLEALIPAEARTWCDVKTCVERGIPFRVILKLLQDQAFDLMVMNIHGKSLLDRALIGSTAERVVRGSPCPVLMIPPTGEGRECANAIDSVPGRLANCETWSGRRSERWSPQSQKIRDSNPQCQIAGVGTCIVESDGYLGFPMVTISMTCATDNLEMERILTTCHKPTVQKLQEGDIMTLRCTDLLRGEHKLILRAAYVLEAMAGQVPADGEPNLRDVQTLLMFLRKFADNHHQGKEETVLFPALRRFELPATGPLRHMMFEHEQDRSLIDGIEDAVLSHHGANFVYYAKRLANILTTHIYKEDHILFDLAATVLTKEDDARLEREMARFDEDLDAQTREMLMESLTRLEWKYLGKTAPSV